MHLIDVKLFVYTTAVAGWLGRATHTSRCLTISLTSQTRPGSAASAKNGKMTSGGGGGGVNGGGPSLRNTGLTGEEIKIVRRAKEEFQRRCGWIRIFPSPDSWELYSSYMQYTTTHNLMLWQQLFPDRCARAYRQTTGAYG